MQKSKTAAEEAPWIVSLRDGTTFHSLETNPTSTQVDKAAFPTPEAAIAQAAKQLGVITVGPHCWWECHG
jgi:hypothetical protein